MMQHRPSPLSLEAKPTSRATPAKEHPLSYVKLARMVFSSVMWHQQCGLALTDWEEEVAEQEGTFSLNSLSGMPTPRRKGNVPFPLANPDSKGVETTCGNI